MLFLTKDEQQTLFQSNQLIFNNIPQDSTPLLENNQNKQLLQQKSTVDYSQYEKTQPRDQGNRDICSPSAVTGLLENKFRIGKWLSIQELINCGKNYKETIYNLQYILQNGISFENDFPIGSSNNCYKNQQQRFNIAQSSHTAAGYRYPTNDCNDQKLNVERFGPVVVGLNSQQLLNYYHYTGIMRDSNIKSNNNIDHAVLLIGYTPNYWIVKNSWGTGWGDNGYGKIAMGNSFGICEVVFGLVPQ